MEIIEEERMKNEEGNEIPARESATFAEAAARYALYADEMIEITDDRWPTAMLLADTLLALGKDLDRESEGTFPSAAEAEIYRAKLEAWTAMVAAAFPLPGSGAASNRLAAAIELIAGGAPAAPGGAPPDPEEAAGVRPADPVGAFGAGFPRAL